MPTVYVSPEQVKQAKRYPLPGLFAGYTRLVPKGKGWYMTNCLFHEDKTASLSLKQYPDGCWRYKCFGCDQAGDPIQFLQIQEGMTFMDAVAHLSEKAKDAPVRPVQTHTYEYRDEAGTLLYEVCRYEPKNFRIRRPDPDGPGCIWNCKDVRRVLYRLENFSKWPEGSTMFYVEGEKDVHTLERQGLFATTHAGGASSWRDELLDQIPKSYRLVLVPDMDDPGKQLMRRIWNAATNDKRDVHFLLLPKSKDVTDFFEQGGTVAELEQEIK